MQTGGPHPYDNHIAHIHMGLPHIRAFEEPSLPFVDIYAWDSRKCGPRDHVSTCICSVHKRIWVMDPRKWSVHKHVWFCTGRTPFRTNVRLVVFMKVCLVLREGVNPCRIPVAGKATQWYVHLEVLPSYYYHSTCCPSTVITVTRVAVHGCYSYCRCSM